MARHAGGRLLRLRLVFHIERGADGALHATLDSPDQNATGIAVDTAVFDAPHLQLEIARLHARFDGTLDGDRLAGTFSQGRAMPTWPGCASPCSRSPARTTCRCPKTTCR